MIFLLSKVTWLSRIYESLSLSFSLSFQLFFRDSIFVWTPAVFSLDRILSAPELNLPIPGKIQFKFPLTSFLLQLHFFHFTYIFSSHFFYFFYFCSHLSAYRSFILYAFFVLVFLLPFSFSFFSSNHCWFLLLGFFLFQLHFYFFSFLLSQSFSNFIYWTFNLFSILTKKCFFLILLR